MVAALRRRLALARRQDGFTLIELLVVVIIIGVLVGIAVPGYMMFKDRAQKRAAQSNLRIAIASAEAYAEASDGAYTGMTSAKLKAIDSSIDETGLLVDDVTADDYCLQYAVGEHTARFVRSAGVLEVDAGGCP